MRKIMKYIIVLLVCVIGINSVNASEVEPLDYHGLYCYYLDETTKQEYHLIIRAHYQEVHWDFDSGGDSPFPLLQQEYGKLNNINFQDQESQDYFVRFGLFSLNSNTKSYYWTCPSDSSVLGISGLKLIKQGCYDGNCDTSLVPSSYEEYTCNYKSSTGNGTIKIDYVNNAQYINGKWDIKYSDGTSKTFIGTEINGNFMPSSECEDIYYIPSEKEIRVALKGNEGVSNNPTLGNLCEKYKISEIEHFCSGECYYPEMNCPNTSYNTVSCGDLQDIPAALPIFIKNIITIIKIAVPIILVIMGMIDFAKAMMSNDDKAMKDSQNKFIKRIIGAVAVFLVVSVTQFIFRVINQDDTNYMASCIDCFINGDCIGGANDKEPDEPEKKTCADYDVYSCPSADDYGNECLKKTLINGETVCAIKSLEKKTCENYDVQSCPSADDYGNECFIKKTLINSETVCAIKSLEKKTCGDYDVQSCPSTDDYENECFIKLGEGCAIKSPENPPTCEDYTALNCPLTDDYGNVCGKKLYENGKTVCAKKS